MRWCNSDREVIGKGGSMCPTTQSARKLANGLPLYTRDPDDFTGLESLIEVHAI